MVKVKKGFTFFCFVLYPFVEIGRTCTWALPRLYQNNVLLRTFLRDKIHNIYNYTILIFKLRCYCHNSCVQYSTKSKPV